MLFGAHVGRRSTSRTLRICASTELAGRWVEQQYRIAVLCRVTCIVRPKASGTIDTIYTDLNEVIEFDERLTTLSRLLLGA